jgi:hypothetical protein
MANNLFLDEVLENISEQIENIIQAEMIDEGILTKEGGLIEDVQFYSPNTYRRNKERFPVILTSYGTTSNVSSTQWCQEEHEIEIGFFVYVKNSDPVEGVKEASKIAARVKRLFRKKENLRLGLDDNSVILVKSGTFLRDSTSNAIAQNNVYSSYSSIIVKFKTIEL